MYKLNRVVYYQKFLHILSSLKVMNTFKGVRLHTEPAVILTKGIAFIHNKLKTKTS